MLSEARKLWPVLEGGARIRCDTQVGCGNLYHQQCGKFDCFDWHDHSISLCMPWWTNHPGGTHSAQAPHSCRHLNYMKDLHVPSYEYGTLSCWNQIQWLPQRALLSHSEQSRDPTINPTKASFVHRNSYRFPRTNSLCDRGCLVLYLGNLGPDTIIEWRGRERAL